MSVGCTEDHRGPGQMVARLVLGPLLIKKIRRTHTGVDSVGLVGLLNEKS